ncbi:uncharacterized protein BYT42DRAFT_550788 [Radiomyces spectabilis]|uniref:uncharacterized protein n=1 Tax=Radiomyces spectabilis TaxID=64574 RepID=UPI00221F8F6F|nr:uncharacterized protein BYT42DRAFT_550788 [Radiomyces spectabilis]KAI8393368.1 hypothetical protein BYT42DRAFT_550788 [Radiomyces spectabilis]
MSGTVLAIVAIALSVLVLACTSYATFKVPLFRTRGLALSACFFSVIEAALLCALCGNAYASTSYVLQASGTVVGYLSTLFTWMVLFDTLLLNKHASMQSKWIPYSAWFAAMVAIALGGSRGGMQVKAPYSSRSSFIALNITAMYFMWIFVILFTAAAIRCRRDIAHFRSFVICGALLSLNPVYQFVLTLCSLPSNNTLLDHVSVLFGLTFVFGNVGRYVALIIASWSSHHWLRPPRTYTVTKEEVDDGIIVKEYD